MSQISRKLLCVDDEPNVLEGLRRQLRHGYDVTTATGPLAGLDAVRLQGPFAVVVTDYKMPEMSGVEFLREVLNISPDTVTVMLTGFADVDVAITALHEGRIFRFLQKPCSPEMLEKAIQSALEQYRLVVSERQLTREVVEANAKLKGMNENLETMINARTAEIRRLYQFVTELNGLDLLDDVAQAVVNTTAEMLHSEKVSLMTPGQAREYLQVLAAVGIPRDVIEGIRVPIGSGIAGNVFATAESIVVNDPEDLPSDHDRCEDEFLASVPLASSLLPSPSGPVGVLNVTGHLGNVPYQPEHLATLRAVSEAAAIALRNQMRLSERNEARDAIMLALAKLAECRDPETGVHLDRVRTYCRMLTVQLAATSRHRNISRSFIDSMYRSSPLHDIGKVGIPDAILLKPGKLTPDEFEIMKQHANIGGDTIRAVIKEGRSQEFLQVGMEIAYGHHEKFDGSGYPLGLIGTAIPLSARIMAVADVYDALTSRRVYKPAFSHEKSCEIIRADSGKHFDPDVVEAFFREEKEFARLGREMADQFTAECSGDTSQPISPVSLARA